MLLQTNSYIVPKDKRAQHARLVQRFRQTLTRLGCDHFEAYEQVGANWSPADTTGRFVQLMRFRDRKQQLAVQAAERNDATAQALIKEFCELINFPYQQQQGLFAVGFYHSLLPTVSARRGESTDDADEESAVEAEEEQAAVNGSPEPGEPASDEVVSHPASMSETASHKPVLPRVGPHEPGPIAAKSIESKPTDLVEPRAATFSEDPELTADLVEEKLVEEKSEPEELDIDAFLSEEEEPNADDEIEINEERR